MRKEHDDGHAAKFIIALKNGEDTVAEFEGDEWKDYFPMRGDMWLKLARMCQDTTKNLPTDLKWVPFIIRFISRGIGQTWQTKVLATIPNIE